MVCKARKKYIQLSDGDIAPDDLNAWTEEIMSLAGWVVDMALLIENERRKLYDHSNC